MDNKRPKRRKDKYNPYTLSMENQKYYVTFKDINGNIQKTKVNKAIFDAFDSFELDDISIMNEYDRHHEHSKVYEHTLQKKKDSSDWSLEEYFDNAKDAEDLHIAMNKLPEIQKRRLKKYYFEEKTFEKIALEEGCTYQSIQRSVYRAVAKIKNILKRL